MSSGISKVALVAAPMRTRLRLPWACLLDEWKINGNLRFVSVSIGLRSLHGSESSVGQVSEEGTKSEGTSTMQIKKEEEEGELCNLHL